MARLFCTRTRVALALVALAALAVSTSAQNPPQSSEQPQQQPSAGADAQQPVFRSGIDYVRVDVIVTDKNGNPAADLKPGDFDVTEDGKPQTIDTFKLVKLDGGVVPNPDGPPRAI